MPTLTQCAAQTLSGEPCQANPITGRSYCRWHSPDQRDRDRDRDESRGGGLTKAYGALACVPPLIHDPVVADLDLNTVDGLRTLVAQTLGAVAQLPVDIRSAIVIGQLAGTQRTLIAMSEFEQRRDSLEKARRWAAANFGGR